MSRQSWWQWDTDDLTYALAKELLDWYDAPNERAHRFHDGERRQFLPLPSAPVLDYLLCRRGAELLHFSEEHGALVDARQIRFEVGLAQAIVTRCQSEGDCCDEHAFSWIQGASSDPTMSAPPSQPASELVSMLPAEPPPPETPADCVAWNVADEGVLKDAIKRLEAKTGKREENRVGQLRELERFAEASRRYLPKASMRYVEAVDALVRRFPNFSEVIGPIRRALHLQIRTGGAVHFRPQLLLGAPGVGKTAFVRSLAEALGATFVFQSLAELSAGFVINGNSARWHSSSPGLIANAICSLPPGKPLLVLFDELDKVHVNSNYPPDGVLLGLLEPATAARFQDEYIQIPMDVSKVMFVFTANRISGVRPELLSRMKQTLIPAPRPEDMPAVVRSVDEAIRADQPAFNDLFAPLSDEVIAALAVATPRQVYRALEEAYAAACEHAPSDCPRIEITAAVMPKVESAKDLPVAAPQRRDWPLLLPEPASKWPN